MMQRRPYKFPLPKDCKAGDKAVICPAERVIRLYNQANKATAKKIAKNVKAWFTQEAKDNGWAGAHFIKEVQSSYGAGCILFMPPQRVNVNVRVKHDTFIIQGTD